MIFRMDFKKILPLLFFFAGAINVFAGDIPVRPEPPRLVNDFAAILSTEQISSLEQKVVVYNDSTSTQIAVVIVKSLNGYDKSDFAYRIGQAWGIGQKGKNNGVVILVKPKDENEKGEVVIETGYGMEGVLPDALCKRIIENEMIPEFRLGDYYKGIDRAVDAIISISKGEYNADKKTRGHSSNTLVIVIIIFIIMMIIINNSKKGRNHTIGRNSTGLWWGAGSIGRSGGSWGGFSSGSGSFGGFGGGSFGGGGAGGSW
jgi:uncharacterized protein